MQASVLFSLAVSTDFTLAAGRRGHVCLRCSCKGLSLQGSCDGVRGGAENRTRETASSPVQGDDEEEWSTVDNLTGVGG